MGIYEHQKRAAQDGDAWAAKYVEHTDAVRAQLAALAAGPRARWRRWRLLEYVCQSCGETVLEVMNTQPGPVVHSRRAPGEGWSFYRLESPLPSPSARPNRMVPAVCRCQSRDLAESTILKHLHAGTKRVVFPAQHDPEWNTPQ